MENCSRNGKASDRLPVVETIAGLTVSPETDIPFGKPLRMGLYEYTIYERSSEQGYYAGIVAHFDFMHDQNSSVPLMLDDEGFSIVLDGLMPKGLTAHDRYMWRAHFVAGWASVFLGLVRELDDDKPQEPAG
jgi:hypothetical protein